MSGLLGGKGVRGGKQVTGAAGEASCGPHGRGPHARTARYGCLPQCLCALALVCAHQLLPHNLATALLFVLVLCRR